MEGRGWKIEKWRAACRQAAGAVVEDGGSRMPNAQCLMPNAYAAASSNAPPAAEGVLSP